MDESQQSPEIKECQDCGARHAPDRPHDATSLYYQIRFLNAHKRYPTWIDAVVHCTPEVQSNWVHELGQIGIDANSMVVQPSQAHGERSAS